MVLLIVVVVVVMMREFRMRGRVGDSVLLLLVACVVAYGVVFLVRRREVRNVVVARK